MQFLKTVLWVLIAVLVAFFLKDNSSPVTLNLWSDIQVETKQPVVIIASFLIGFVPVWLKLRARIWSLNRRIDAMERNRIASLPSETPAEMTEPAA